MLNTLTAVLLLILITPVLVPDTVEQLMVSVPVTGVLICAVVIKDASPQFTPAQPPANRIYESTVAVPLIRNSL